MAKPEVPVMDDPMFAVERVELMKTHRRTDWVVTVPDPHPTLWPDDRLHGRIHRDEAAAVIIAGHYLQSFPSGWVYCYRYEAAVLVFSIPANKNLETYLYDRPVGLRELARLWAPAHQPHLLTQAISTACRALRADTECEAVVSFADPNHGHHGGVYQAASWTYTGRSSESRVYVTGDGRTISRRAFHSGGRSALPNLPERRMPGKYRYARSLTRAARRAERFIGSPYPKNEVGE